MRTTKKNWRVIPIPVTFPLSLYFSPSFSHLPCNESRYGRCVCNSVVAGTAILSVAHAVAFTSSSKEKKKQSLLCVSVCMCVCVLPYHRCFSFFVFTADLCSGRVSSVSILLRLLLFVVVHYCLPSSHQLKGRGNPSLREWLTLVPASKHYSPLLFFSCTPLPKTTRRAICYRTHTQSPAHLLHLITNVFAVTSLRCFFHLIPCLVSFTQAQL